MANAQPAFQKTFHGTGYSVTRGFSIQQTADGGYIVAGFTNSFGAGSEDVYLIKTNAAGDTLWTRTYGGSASDYGYSVWQTSDSGYVVAGLTSSFGSGKGDVFLVRTNSGGDMLWAKTYGGALDDAAYAVTQTPDNGYMIAGYTESYGAGVNDMYVIRTNSSGDTLWTKTFGGTGEDQAFSVQPVPGGGYVIGGTAASFGSGDEVYVVRTDAGGKLLWSKTYGGSGYDDGLFLQETSDSGYVMAGFTSSFGAGGDDIYLIKTDSAGTLQWTKAIGGTGNDDGYYVQETGDGGYVVTGFTHIQSGNDDLFLLKTDSGGNPEWSEAFGGTNLEYGYSVALASGGGYAAAGSAFSFGSWGESLYLLAVDSAGASGCNQIPFPVTATAPSTHVSVPATQVASGGSIANASAQSFRGGVPQTLCSLPLGTAGEGSVQANVQVYTGPERGTFRLKINPAGPASLQLYDLLGAQVYSAVADGSFLIHLGGQPAGVYVYRIQSGDHAYTGKLMVD